MQNKSWNLGDFVKNANYEIQKFDKKEKTTPKLPPKRIRGASKTRIFERYFLNLNQTFLQIWCSQNHYHSIEEKSKKNQEMKIFINLFSITHHDERDFVKI